MILVALDQFCTCLNYKLTKQKKIHPLLGPKEYNPFQPNSVGNRKIIFPVNVKGMYINQVVISMCFAMQ
jgi:hypothetical protein